LVNPLLYEFDEFFIGNRNPMYVQSWRGPSSPRDGSRNVVFIPGGAHTGVSWTTTPDGRPGWARLFASAGWTSFVVDWAGVGRSRLEAGQQYAPNAVITDRVAQLLRRLGSSVVVGHSYGLPIAAKAMDSAPGSVSHIIGVAPSAPGNVQRPEAPVSEDDNLWLPTHEARAALANADNFPGEAWDDYQRSLVPYSPLIRNACGDRDGIGDLVVDDIEALQRVPSLMLIGDQEAMSSQYDVEEIANFFGADVVRLREQWGLSGHAHMIPIEHNTDLIVGRLLDWLSPADSRG
jgi:pimeloyl-ACP methyl ester carboxylesterase